LKVSEPAGGSLTADEYRFATTVVWPIIMSHLHLIHVMVPLLQPQIPKVWDQFQCKATKDFDNANKKYDGQLAAYLQDLAKWEQRQQHPSTSTTTGKGKGKGKAGDDKHPVPLVKPLPCMHEDKPVNFLHLAAALKILLVQNVNEATILRGSWLFEDYILHYKEVHYCGWRAMVLIIHQIYDTAAMKPSHHWAVHLPDQLRDYGPVYNFWTFLTERLNKLLKSSNTNNWTGGQLEISMMREFQRSTHIQAMVSSLSKV